jgi:hypothetical protein
MVFPLSRERPGKSTPQEPGNACEFKILKNPLFCPID